MTELERVQELVNKARHDFLVESERFSTEGQEDRAKLEKHLKRFLDDEVRRADEFREAADGCLASLCDFELSRTALESALGNCHNAMGARVSKLTLSVFGVVDDRLAAMVRRARALEARSKGEAQPQKDASPSQDFLPLIDEAVSVGKQVAELYEIGRQVYIARQKVMQAFVDDNLTLTVDHFIAALTGTAQGKVRNEAISSAGTAMLGPQAAAAVGLAAALVEKLKKVHQPYRGRGPEDLLFDLQKVLRAQDQLFKDAKTHVDTAFEALVKPMLPEPTVH